MLFICERDMFSLQLENHFTLEEDTKNKFTKITEQLFWILQESPILNHGLRLVTGMKGLDMTQPQKRAEVEEIHVHSDLFLR